MRRARRIHRRPLSTLGCVFWAWMLEVASVPETLQVGTWDSTEDRMGVPLVKVYGGPPYLGVHRLRATAVSSKNDFAHRLLREGC